MRHPVQYAVFILGAVLCAGCRGPGPTLPAPVASLTGTSVTNLGPEGDIQLSVTLSVNKPRFQIGEDVVVRVRIENITPHSSLPYPRGGRTFSIGFNCGYPWYERVVVIVSKEHYINTTLDSGWLPNGEPSWNRTGTTAFLSGGTSHRLEAGDALEHVFRYKAKKPGRYVAVASVDSGLEKDRYYTGRTPFEYVEYPVPAFIRFKTEPIMLEFEVLPEGAR